MNPNILWIILALTNKWYYTILLFSALNPVIISSTFSALWQNACNLPVTHPIAPLVSYICAGTTAHHDENVVVYNTAVVSGYSGLNNLISSTVQSDVNHLPNALASIDDAVFLAKSSLIDCEEEVTIEFSFLESGSRRVGESLEELKAKVLSSVDLVIASSDHLLELLSEDQENTSSTLHSVFCLVVGRSWQFHTCRASRPNILLAFNYTVSKLESTIEALYVIADTIELELNELELHLRVIRDLLAREAGAVVSGRDDLVADAKYWIGWHRRELLRYDTRLNAINSIMVYRGAASHYVGGVRSRLRSVSQELKVLKELAMEPEKAQEVLSLKGFTRSLRLGVFRLREAQIATFYGGADTEDLVAKVGSKTQEISQ